MPNMSYCRFENTNNDLKDCFNALMEDGLQTLGSQYEKDAAENLFYIAKKFVKLYNDLKNEEAARAEGLDYDE